MGWAFADFCFLLSCRPKLIMVLFLWLCKFVKWPWINLLQPANLAIAIHRNLISDLNYRVRDRELCSLFRLFWSESKPNKFQSRSRIQSSNFTRKSSESRSRQIAELCEKNDLLNHDNYTRDYWRNSAIVSRKASFNKPWKAFYQAVTILQHHKRNHDGQWYNKVRAWIIKLKSNKHKVWVKKGCNQVGDQKLIEM